MKRKILLGLMMMAIVLMAVLEQTKPDRAAHYDAVKKMALKAVDHELLSNPITAEYATTGIMTALTLVANAIATTAS